MKVQNFSEKEKAEARKNGFILGGKTGAGKSTLLNAIMGEEVAIVKKDSYSVTQETSVYYYKLKNGKMISILDTPGLMDTNLIKDPNVDNIHLAEIREKVFKENIQVKGIIFLVNFQNERFDSSEQEALINYNKIFPLEDFWEHILVVFTHYFSDPDGDTEEEMKKTRDKSNKKILGDIMQKIKNISRVINYNDLITKYFNSYSPVKNPKQREKNNRNKEELEVILENISKKAPLFTKIEIVTKKDFVYEENNIYYKGTLIIIGFIGLAEKPIKEERYIEDRNKITKEQYLQLKDNISDVKIDKIEVGRNEGGELKPETTKNANDGYYYGLFKNSGIGGLIGAGIGVLGAGLLCLTPVGAGALAAYSAGAIAGGAVGGGGIIGAVAGFFKGLFS